MLEHAGDCWEFADEWPAQAICVLTNMQVMPNGELVMGGGQAREARDRYPDLAVHWGAHYRSPENVAETKLAVYFPESDGPVLVSFPTKYSPAKRADLALIAECARDLDLLADVMGWDAIVLPRPGCGLGGLNWTEVKPVIDFLDDRFIAMTFARPGEIEQSLAIQKRLADDPKVMQELRDRHDALAPSERKP